MDLSTLNTRTIKSVISYLNKLAKQYAEKWIRNKQRAAKAEEFRNETGLQLLK